MGLLRAGVVLVSLLPSVAFLVFLPASAFSNGILSLGGVIYPIAFRGLLRHLSFGWSVRILAFIVLATSLIAIALLRDRARAAKKRVLFDLHVFFEAPFALFTLALAVGMAGLYVPSYYIETFAVQTKITDAKLGSYVLPILNAAGMFGRVIPNFFADQTGPMNMLIPCVIVAVIVCFGWIGVHNVAGLMVFAILYGFFSGAILSLPPSVMASLSPSLAVIGTRAGTSFAVASLGLLVGSPVAGALLHGSGSHVGLQAFAGALLLAAAVGMSLARICRQV